MKNVLQWGGVAAAIVLIALGASAIVVGANGRSMVHSSLRLEQIVGSSDMNPTAIAAEAKKAGLSPDLALPTVDVSNKAIDTGARARAFASYMRIHALEASGGLTYSQLPRFATVDGKGTNDPAKAQTSPTGQPLDNPVRNVWVSETALSTALNSSYMAEQVALFGIVVGAALLLSGIGFLVLTLGGALGRPAFGLRKIGRRAPVPS